MDAWLGQVYDLLLYVFGRATSEETGVLVGLCILLGALALSRVGTSLGALGAFYTTGVLLLPVGLLLVFAAMAVPSLFGFYDCWMPLTAAVIALLVLVLPLTVLFQKGGYVAALIAWTVALLIVGAVLTLEPMAMHKIDKGVQKFHEIEKHRNLIDDGMIK
ncbi:MAG: hypothetical protein IT583_06595 [Verrucomicrobia bacterium]|nr:hypothetical protein [Verrucomicrobiota bacterium]